MKSIYLNPSSGISGNMFLGALIAAGYPSYYVEGELQSLHLGNYELVNETVTKAGIRAHYFDVELPEQHHEHRHLQDILEILNTSNLSDSIKHSAGRVFYELARAEAKVHGTSIEEVHFHEVGAIDTIIDVVGVLAALEHLGIEKIYFGPVVTGYGTVECAHGLMPVPAPATAELLEGIPHLPGDIDKELTTPTGAVLLKCLGEYREECPFEATTVFFGAGSMDLPIPNVLRLYVEQEDGDLVYEGATNLDNESGEVVAFTMEELFKYGALDAWTEPIYMKKGRPGVKICFLCEKADLETLCNIILEHTKTLGVRFHQVQRRVLPREIYTKLTVPGPSRIKTARCSSGETKRTIEYEDLQKLARERGWTIQKANDRI